MAILSAVAGCDPFLTISHVYTVDTAKMAHFGCGACGWGSSSLITFGPFAGEVTEDGPAVGSGSACSTTYWCRSLNPSRWRNLHDKL
jgi:hypothetical protein